MVLIGLINILFIFIKRTYELLSKDHKPDDKLEMQRILINNGRVDTFRDHNGHQVNFFN